MTGQININPTAIQDRWVCYLDLLGFKNLVLKEDWINVFVSYSKAVETFTNSQSYADLTKYIWFSDTFIMYTTEGTFDAYSSIEQMARHFVFHLINADIPLRGSIAYGQYYADQEQHIHFGKALIEAYEYGEAQDWIGLIQTPSAILKLSEKLNTHHQMNFPYWNIPFKPNTITGSTELPAYRIGESFKANGINSCLSALSAMAARTTNERIRRKYDNTIDFIVKNQLHVCTDK